MSVEFDVDAVYGASSVGFDSFGENEESRSVYFHKAIFAPPYYPAKFDKQVALEFQSSESLKADAVAFAKLGHNVTNSTCSGGAEINVGFGPDGTTFTFDAGVKVEDQDGNYVEAGGTYNSDGTGSARVGGGRNDD